MITLKQLTPLLSTLVIPVAYNDFKDIKGGQPQKPYLVWYVTGTNPTGADNVVAFESNSVNIELYTEIKDFELESKVKKLLTDAGVYYTTSDTTLEGERTHITYFIITVGG